MVLQSSFNVGLQSLLNCCDVGQNRANPHRLQAFIGTYPHPARHDDVAVWDGREHAGVAALCPGTSAVLMTVSVGMRVFVAYVTSLRTDEIMMASLGAQFPIDERPFLDRRHQIVARSAKVGADALAVVRNDGDFSCL